MMAIAAASIIESATGEMGRTAEHAASPIPVCSALPVSPEGEAVAKQLLRVAHTLQRNYIVLATPSTEAALRFAPIPLPDTWLGLAAAVFPNSHAMTREERCAFDASFWPALEPFEFSDE